MTLANYRPAVSNMPLGFRGIGDGDVLPCDPINDPSCSKLQPIDSTPVGSVTSGGVPIVGATVTTSNSFGTNWAGILIGALALIVVVQRMN